MGMIGMTCSIPPTAEEARRASDGCRITSSGVCAIMMRRPASSKRAAVTLPFTRVCPSFISIFEIDGLIVAVKLERGRTLFLGAEAGILSAAKGKLVFHSRAGQVDGEQAGFGAINEFEDPSEVGMLYGRTDSEGKPL